MKLWQKILAGLAAFAGFVLLIVKFLLGKREQKSKDGVTRAIETQQTGAIQDTVVTAEASGKAQGVEVAATAEVVAIAETTEPATAERVDALADSLRGMRRGQ